MSIQIYKPNKSNNGFAFNFSMGIDKRSSEPVLFVSAIAQHSWDSKKRIGSFSENKNNPEKNINLKNTQKDIQVEVFSQLPRFL